MFCLLLVKYVTTLGRATQADPTARRVGPTRRSVRMMAVGDDRQLRVTGNTEGCQVGPSADCKDDGDVSDGWPVSLMGRSDGPSGRADATARRIGSYCAAFSLASILGLHFFYLNKQS